MDSSIQRPELTDLANAEKLYVRWPEGYLNKFLFWEEVSYAKSLIDQTQRGKDFLKWFKEDYVSPQAVQHVFDKGWRVVSDPNCLFYGSVHPERKLIRYDSTLSLDQQMYTIAHELAHVIGMEFHPDKYFLSDALFPFIPHLKENNLLVTWMGMRILQNTSLL